MTRVVEDIGNAVERTKKAVAEVKELRGPSTSPSPSPNPRSGELSINTNEMKKRRHKILYFTSSQLFDVPWDEAKYDRASGMRIRRQDLRR